VSHHEGVLRAFRKTSIADSRLIRQSQIKRRTAKTRRFFSKALCNTSLYNIARLLFAAALFFSALIPANAQNGYAASAYTAEQAACAQQQWAAYEQQVAAYDQQMSSGHGNAKLWPILWPKATLQTAAADSLPSGALWV
jgi:hypothetical protein